MKEKLTHAESLTISSMLFGLFFGAGNLIFPAYLGEASEANLWISLLGFDHRGGPAPFGYRLIRDDQVRRAFRPQWPGQPQVQLLLYLPFVLDHRALLRHSPLLHGSF